MHGFESSTNMIKDTGTSRPPPRLNQFHGLSPFISRHLIIILSSIYIYIIRPIRNAYLIFKFLCLFPGHITNRHNGILIGSCNGRGFVGYIDDVSTVCIFFLNLDTRCFKSMLLASDIVIICVCIILFLGQTHF